MKRLLLAASAIVFFALPATVSAACVQTSITYTTNGGNQVCPSGNGNVIITFLIYIIKFLGGLVGLIVVLMIIIGGVQYITSGGNPQAVGAAKKRIVNAIIALVLYIMMFGILEYLIPGGIFS